MRESQGPEAPEPAEMRESQGPEAPEPGASRHGNFVNYYQFHPAAERLRQMPASLVERAARDGRDSYVALDVGCNSGELSLELLAYLEEKLPGKRISMLGLDLDPALIERARSRNPRPEALAFECLDFLSEERRPLLDSYLRQRQQSRFDVSFCFSVTMWIHLNAGDAGLERFLRELCDCSEALLLEPQPWRCYRSAERRLRRAKLPGFPLLPQLNYRGDMLQHLRHILQQQCGFRQLELTRCNDWQRRLLLCARPELP